MQSLQIAIKKLEQEALSFILVKEGVVLKKSKEKGVKPILDVYKEGISLFEGGAVADKVIGRAAAILLREGKVTKVYGELMSEEAINVLESGNIEYSYNKKVENILNRDKTDLCPMEKLSLGEESGVELHKNILGFIRNK